MVKKSKLETSIKILRDKGYTVTKEGKGWRVVRHPEYCHSPLFVEMPAYRKELGKWDIYSNRELIKLADTYTHNNKQETAIKKNIKTRSKGRERAHVKSRLRPHLAEDADVDFPKHKYEDRWNWD